MKSDLSVFQLSRKCHYFSFVWQIFWRWRRKVRFGWVRSRQVRL